MNINSRLTVGLVAATVVLLLAGCSSTPTPTASPSKAVANASLTLGLVQATDFVHAMPARVAAAEGFFTKEHLTVSIVGFTSGSDLTKGMAGGTVNVGAATGLDAVSASAHGVDLQAFYGIEGPSPMTLIVPSGSSIKTFADLKGKKVGISAFGSMTDYVLRAALKKASVPISDVTEVPLGAPPTTIAAMQHGDIDALVLPINFGYTPGTGTIAQKASALLGNNDQFAVLMAQDTYIASNTAVLKRLAVSYTDAINWMKTHKSATVSLAESALGMTAVVANKTYDALMPGFTPSGALNASGLAGYAKALPTLNIATTVPAASSYLSTAVIGK